MMKILDQHKFNVYYSRFSFEKGPEEDIIDYDFKLSFNHIQKSFSKHYNQLMAIERECYEFEDDLEDFYIALNELGFPDLSIILNKDRLLFFLFTQEYLRYEFLDSVCNGYPKDKTKYGFGLSSLKEMTLLDDGIRIEGSGILMLPLVFKKLSYEESLDIFKELS